MRVMLPRDPRTRGTGCRVYAQLSKSTQKWAEGGARGLPNTTSAFQFWKTEASGKGCALMREPAPVTTPSPNHTSENGKG